MSRLAKKPLSIPQGTSVTWNDNILQVKGPKGEIARTFKPLFTVEVAPEALTLTPKRQDQQTLALWGTYASHIMNMIEGVNEPFSKKLIVEGVGYRAQLQGKKLVLDLGFSHKIEVDIPEGLDVSVEKEVITVTGIDKDQVGQFAANVRAYREPEPYKGKGIRYEDEVVRRKQGKKAV